MECGGGRFPLGHAWTDRNSLGSAAILHIKRHLSRRSTGGNIKLETIATMESDASAYDQTDATRFTRLNALRLKVRALSGESG
jgi:hypothetical protein